MDVAVSADPARLPAIRLTLVISSLRSGGAERVMSLLANAWVAGGLSVTLVTFATEHERPGFSLDDGVELVSLDLIAHSQNMLVGLLADVRRAAALRRAITSSRPDVVVSFMDRTNVLTLFATVGLRVPTVVAERNDPAEERMSRAWTMLRAVAYRRAARVVTQSEAALSYFAASIRRRGRVIPNPVVLPVGASGMATLDEPTGPTVVAIGRLVPQKGFDLLLDAFARLEPGRRHWTMEIWGEGESRAELEAKRDRLGLRDVVRLPGVTSQPGAVLGRARLFVLSSRYEGFPNVLGEAMALGLPVVAFDCPSGPRDMIRDGVDGILAPRNDVAALALAMERVLEDESLRIAIRTRAPEILDRFGMDVIMTRWDALLFELTAARTA